MSVTTFYNPALVEKLRRAGIGAGARPQLPNGSSAPGPRGALELVEECARLRAENRRLSEEIVILRAEAARRPHAPQREDLPADDAAQRFALLELDL